MRNTRSDAESLVYAVSQPGDRAHLSSHGRDEGPQEADILGLPLWDTVRGLLKTLN